MKFLKLAGWLLLALILLVALLSLIAPKEVVTRQSLEIGAPAAAVYAAVNEFRTWEHWSPWVQRDSTIRPEYGPTTAGKGASYAWTSQYSGTGQMTITEAYPSDSLHTLVEFDGQGSTLSNFYFEPATNGTKVTWTFHTQFPKPFNVMLLFQDFKGMIDKDYADGLGYLKKYVEAQSPKPADYVIEEIDFPATHFLGTRQQVGFDQMSAFFQTEMPKVGMAFAEQNLQMTGAPVGLYFEWNEAAKRTDMAVACPAPTGATLAGLTVFDLPAAKALRIQYYGPYEGTGAAHYALDDYMAAKKLKAAIPVMERYVTDPGTEPDTTKWLTEIIYLIEQ